MSRNRAQDFLKELEDRAGGVDLERSDLEPDGRKRTDEVYVGILPDRQRQLWIVWQELVGTLTRHARKHEERFGMWNGESLTDDDVVFLEQHNLFMGRVNLVRELFWQEVREVMPRVALGTSPRVCIGWQVVVSVTDNPLAEVALRMK